MSFTGFIHFGHSAFDFISPCLPKDSNALCGDGWRIEGDSVASSEYAVCAFHGFLTNRRDLCDSLGLPLDTAAPQVILRLHAEKQSDFKPLRGHFCFAIIDLPTRKLLLVRDQLGAEILFHAALSNGTHVFSTSLNSLRTLPCVPSQISLKSLFDYLSLGYVPSPRTIFNGIEKIRPAHRLVISENACEDEAFWQPQFNKKQKINFHDAVAEAWKLLDIAVRRCLDAHPNADVLLSGGIDSNIVLALASTSDNFGKHAYTVGFADANYDERRLASLSAKKYNVAHELMQVLPSAWGELPAAQKLNGEPYGDSSIIPTICALRLAKEHGSTTVMTGSGGDEFFGGYRRYQAMAVRHFWRWLPNFIVRPTASLILKFLGEPEDSRARFATLSRFVAFWKKPPLPGYAAFQEIFSEDLKQQLCQNWTKNAAVPYLDEWAEMSNSMGVNDFVEKFNALDVMAYLPDDGCRKEGLAANLVGIADECPIMDLDVVEFALSLPRKLRVTCRKRKRVLHGIGSYLLPPELLKQTKRGFGMPVSSWFRNECVDSLHNLANSVKSWDRYGWFKPEAIENLCDDHLNSRRDNGSKLWILLCLKTWLEQL
ncbi:MAG: hypothetical protein J6X49_14995 [Victivallales bacterium]|nr:hypothetical protein [Victivallales bacterium]